MRPYYKVLPKKIKYNIVKIVLYDLNNHIITCYMIIRCLIFRISILELVFCLFCFVVLNNTDFAEAFVL